METQGEAAVGMNTTQLECFLAVANHLNFSRAAEQLQITQPAVSHQIKTLEDELGTALFRRNSKGVRLTQEGHLFTQYAEEILKLSGLSKARLRESKYSKPRRFGMGCRSVGELRLLRPVLRKMKEEEPGLLPILRLVPFDSLENLLMEGDIQVMFVYGEAAPKNGAYRELAWGTMSVVCAEDHPLAGWEQVEVSQLREAGRIAAGRPPVCPPSLCTVQGQIIGGQESEQVIFCENREVMDALVESGVAFSLAVDVPQLRTPGLRYIPITGTEQVSFGVSYRMNERNPVLRRFLRLLEEEMSGKPGY